MSARLHATRLGPAPADLVFLHGLFGQGRNWQGVAKALAPLGSLLLDLPDHGDSAWTDAVDLDAWADVIAHRLRVGGAADRPVTLVGHSLGGKVAMRLALRHPHLVGRLAVIDIAPAPRALGDFARYTEAMAAVDLTTLRDRRAIDEALVPAVPDPRVRGFLLQNLRRTPDGSGYAWRANLGLLGRSLDVVGGWPPTAGLAPYDGPVAWVAGALSTYVRPEHHAPMRALFPRVRLVTVKGAGHWVHADRPDVVVDVLRHLAGAAPG